MARMLIAMAWCGHSLIVSGLTVFFHDPGLTLRKTWGEGDTRKIYSTTPSLLSYIIGFDDLQVCADPGIPENGIRTPSAGVFFESSVTRFHCQDGFKLRGSTKRLCMKHLNGSLGWIPNEKPICVQEGKVLTPLPALPCLKLFQSSCKYVAFAQGYSLCFREKFL